MSQAKASAKKAPARKKAGAARAEKNSQPKTVDFRGLKLELPAKIPGSLLWDINDFEAGSERSMRGFMELLNSLLGPEQNRAVRDKVQSDKLSVEETFPALEELIADVMESSGLSLGE